MPDTPWQRRAARAELLAAQHPFAGEILGFYVHLAHFQGALHRDLLTETRNIVPNPLPSPSEVPILVSSFGSFLSLIQRHGPIALRPIANDLNTQGSPAWSEALNSVWLTLDGPATTVQLLAKAFLQPYAEFLRSKATLQRAGYNHPLCPFCSRKPLAGVLRQQGDGAARWLLCGFCLAEWEFRRIVCPACGEEDNRKLPVYMADQFDYVRVECCDNCRIYLKSVDLTRNGLAEPLVDEIASAPLDLWAREHGYAKLQPNLLGM